MPVDKNGNGEDDQRSEHHPRTAAGEVLREFENAETDVDDSREKPHRGEAAEAITPSPGAEEDAERKAEDD
ncbi:hypothetical protein ABZ858_17910 [Streptomyces sp. NPDC047017]|uniref:hypothetical protein n=1 Tax=Streptomyces sp. NPDC047017 TaxID=3155024 RepID=UPI0033C539B2